MNADRLLHVLKQHGFGLFSGVPCSYLTPLINATIDAPEIRYVNAANEGEAVAICSGAELGGLRSVVMFQNSGLGNAVSPLTSLNTIFRIPLLVISTWRGQPGGASDEPQHALVGRIMPDLFQTMEIPYAVFPTAEHELTDVLCKAKSSMDETGLPFALLMQKGSIDTRELQSKPPPRRMHAKVVPAVSENACDADDCLAAIAAAANHIDAAVIATTGFTGRALYNLGDRENQFYMVGSMGCASSLALGIAVARPTRHVIAIDGDGALLMRLGALPGLAAESPANLTHVVLDNGVHDSTGAQASLSHTVNIPALAAACGYPRVEVADSAAALRSLLQTTSDELRMIYVHTSPRQERRLPRPTITPPQVAVRLRRWLARETDQQVT